MLIGVYTDYMGHFLAEGEQEERERIIDQVREGLLYKDLKPEFKIYEQLHEALNPSPDILLVDYGGVGLGYPGVVDSFNHIVQYILEESPSCLVVILTDMTVDNMIDMLEDELADYKGMPNLVLPNRDMTLPFGRMSEWLKGIKKETKNEG